MLMKPSDVELSLLAARQHGVVTRDQARALGLTPRQVDLRVTAGALVRIHQGVYRLASSRHGFEQGLVAACLATGGVASHRAAAHLLGLRGIESAPLELTVSPRGNHRIQRVRVHRSELHPADVGRHGPIPVTRPARTLLDLGAVAPRLLEGAVEDALLQGLVTVEGLWRVLDRSGSRGGRGAGPLRRLLETRDPAQAPTESPLEDAVLAILHRFNLPNPVRQHLVHRPGHTPFRLDIAYPDALVDIEVDGLRWHLGAADASRDRERDNFLASLGWAVLRFTSYHVRRQPAQLAARVGQLLRSRRHLAAG